MDPSRRRLLFPLTILFAASGCERTTSFVAGVESVSPAELQRMMARPPVLLLDVRPAGEQQGGHLRGSLGLTLEEAPGWLGRTRERRDLPLFCLGATAFDAAHCTALARASGFRAARSLRGGMAAWRARGLPLEAGKPPRPAAALLDIPKLEIDRFSEVVNTASGCVIKPLYMILALLLIRQLRGRRERDLKLLRWSMWAFFVGEGFCAINFAPGIGNRWYIDLAHGAGMVLMGAWLAAGIFELLDERVLRFADRESRCVLQRFCGHCWKRDEVRCGLQRLFRLLAPALGLVSLIPLSAPLQPLRFTMDVFASTITTEYYWPLLWIELRLYPVAACLLLLATAFLLRGGPASIRRAQGPFFWGLGFMSYSTIRFLLLEAFFPDPTWADFWEELTELITVAALGMLLRVFREQLGLGKPAGAPSPETRPT